MTIRVHVTFVILVVLVAVSADQTGESMIAALGWLSALFACVVVHELAHAQAARSKGIAVHEIDLLPIGGVSRLESVPEGWRDEAVIAAAGPLASLALAGLAFAVAAAVGLPPVPASMWDGPILVRLGWVNLLLAAFNLVPAFPLDGGRVLRALLERHRSRLDATRRAVRISRIVATAMIAIGLLVNVWLMVIGVFVIMAAGVEEAAVLIHAALGTQPAYLLAMPCPLLVSGDSDVDALRLLAAENPQPAYVVTEPAGGIVGVVTADVLRRSPPDMLVRELATGATADAGLSLEQIAPMLAAGPVVVTQRGAVVGVITEDGLSRYLERRFREVEA